MSTLNQTRESGIGQMARGSERTGPPPVLATPQSAHQPSRPEAGHVGVS